MIVTYRRLAHNEERNKGQQVFDPTQEAARTWARPRLRSRNRRAAASNSSSSRSQSASTCGPRAAVATLATRWPKRKSGKTALNSASTWRKHRGEINYKSGRSARGTSIRKCLPRMPRSTRNHRIQASGNRPASMRAARVATAAGSLLLRTATVVLPLAVRPTRTTTGTVRTLQSNSSSPKSRFVGSGV